MKKTIKILLKLGDITEIKVDVIVNAANSSLLGGGGVDGAIHRVAGEKLLEECQKIRETKFPDGLPVGQVVLTKGYNSPAKYIIHTVGAIYGRENGKEDELLASCYFNSLKLANECKLKSIAFPSISTGAFGFPVEKAAEIVSKSFLEFIKQFPNSPLEKIIMVVHSQKDLEAYEKYF